VDRENRAEIHLHNPLCQTSNCFEVSRVLCRAQCHPKTRLALVRMFVVFDDAVPLRLQRSVWVLRRARSYNLAGRNLHKA